MSKKQFKHERTCMVCKKKDSKANLLRFVLEDLKLIYDAKKCHEGRGTYIHNNKECLDSLGIQKKLKKAFRINENVNLNLEILESLKNLSTTREKS